MPKGPNGERRPSDVVGCAVRVAKIAIGEEKETEYNSTDPKLRSQRLRKNKGVDHDNF